MTQTTSAARAATTSTPRADGFRLPARFTPHQRTLLSWPCREDLFGPLMDDARKEWAEVARGIARFEPVTVVVDPAQEAEARSLLGLDGGRRATEGRRTARSTSSPSRSTTPGSATTAPSSCATTRAGSRWCTSASTAGASTSRPTTRTRGCRRPSPRPGACGATRRRSCSRAAPSTPTARAPCSPPSSACCTTATSGCSRADNEALLKEWLGVEKVVWLPYGLVEDSGPLSTSGHVDDVAQFVAPGVVMAQTCAPDNPNYARLQENLEALEAATDAAGRRLEVVESPLLPYVSGVGAGLDGVSGPGAGIRMPAPYVNMVFVEGAVLLPLTGEEGEDEMHREIGELVGREPVGLPTELSAFGGGGLGCITQQVPAGPFAPPR